MRVFALAAMAAMLATPVAAWEHGFDANGSDMLHWVIDSNFTNETQLLFYCFSSAPGEVYAQFRTQRPPVGLGQYEPLDISVNGTPLAPLPTETVDIEGHLAIVTPTTSRQVADVARAIYAESGTITVTFRDSQWHFAGADYSEAFGAMLDGCG